MKKMIVLMAICISFMMYHSSAVSESKNVQDNRVLQIAWKWLHDSYPSFTDEDYSHISIEKKFFSPAGSYFSQGSDEWTIFFCYDNKSYMDTYVIIDAITEKIIDFHPWDFYEAVSYYKSIPSEEFILKIAQEEYKNRLKDAMNSEMYSSSYSAFLSKYGEEMLNPNIMITEIYLSNYPHYPGEKTEPLWVVAFKHPKQIELNNSLDVYPWCTLRLDITGSIIDVSDCFFEIFMEAPYRNAQLSIDH